MSKKYQIIYADPPWNGLGWNNGSGLKCPANHYDVQDIEWIKSLQVDKITDDNCALILWITCPNLKKGFDVIKAWGFNYSTCAFTWVKKNKKSDSYFIGCGNYTRANAEICLLATKGSMQKMVKSHSVRQICDAKIMGHSQKPREIRERIVELLGDIPRIELFARKPDALFEDPSWKGWDVWGNEVDSEIKIITNN